MTLQAVAALERQGYDTHETATGMIYIAGMAPDSGDYGGNTEPGSAWDEECDGRLDAIRDIVQPYGCTAEWSDDDVLIDDV